TASPVPRRTAGGAGGRARPQRSCAPPWISSAACAAGVAGISREADFYRLRSQGPACCLRPQAQALAARTWATGSLLGGAGVLACARAVPPALASPWECRQGCLRSDEPQGTLPPRLGGRGEAAVEVGEDVVDMLDADR